MKHTVIVTVFVLVVMGVLSGCKGNPPATGENKPQQPQHQPIILTGAPQEIARKIVERYNQLLADGYRNLDMTPLQEVATEDLAKKAYYHMAALREGLSRMNSTLKKIEFVKIESPAADKWNVQTREVWDFFYSDINSGERHKEVRDYVYYVNYTLENREGRWMITDIVATGDEDPKKNSSWDELFGKNGPARKAH